MIGELKNILIFEDNSYGVRAVEGKLRNICRFNSKHARIERRRRREWKKSERGEESLRTGRNREVSPWAILRSQFGGSSYEICRQVAGKSRRARFFPIFYVHTHLSLRPLLLQLLLTIF